MNTMNSKGFAVGAVVVLTDDAAFFAPASANVLHVVVDVVRGGYRIAPVGGGAERGVFADEIRAAAV